jgi:DNA-binding transcriptional LysR family regulator
MNFEIRLLTCALALEEHRSFAKAAESLHVSQPALSRSIQSLEEIAGVKIFERGTRRVEITDAGGVFLEHAREVMARSSDLSREMELLKGLEKGELKIGVGVYAGDMFVDLVIGRTVRERPKVRLQVVSDTWLSLLSQLRARDVDMAIIDVRTAIGDAEYHITPLTRRQAYPAMRAGHPLLKQKKTLTASDLLHYPLVGISRFPPEVLRELASESAKGDRPSRPELKSFPAIACNSVSMMKNIIKESDAVTFLPLNLMLAELKAKTIVTVDVALPALQLAVGIVRLARRSPSPLGEHFVRTVIAVDAEVAAVEQKAAKELFGRRARAARV